MKDIQFFLGLVVILLAIIAYGVLQLSEAGRKLLKLIGYVNDTLFIL